MCFIRTDESIRSILRSEFGDCTVVTVAHRLSSVVDSDKIILMADGRIKVRRERDKELRIRTRLQNFIQQSKTVFVYRILEFQKRC